VDLLLRKVSELKDVAKFKGTEEKFRTSEKLVTLCRKLSVIAEIRDPSKIGREHRDDYYTHLVALTKKHLFANPSQKNWSNFCADPGNRKIHKILQEFGIRQELFSDNADATYTPLQNSNRNITIEELYELCQIQFNFDGTMSSFKRYLQRTYGSFAEYCIEKGYDINNTRWESKETAIRVAEKLGSIEEIKTRSASLYKYLEENNLFKKANLRAS
jgi:hypothetical protein